MAGHVSPQMLKHYSHIGMEAKRRAVQSLVSKTTVPANNGDGSPDAETAQIPESHAKESPKVTLIN
jgi:hypothetical protein